VKTSIFPMVMGVAIALGAAALVAGAYLGVAFFFEGCCDKPVPLNPKTQEVPIDISWEHLRPQREGD